MPGVIKGPVQPHHVIIAFLVGMIVGYFANDWMHPRNTQRISADLPGAEAR